MNTPTQQSDMEPRASRTYLLAQLLFWSGYFFTNLLFVGAWGFYSHSSLFIFLLLSLLLGGASHGLRNLYRRRAHRLSSFRLGLHLLWLLPLTALAVQALLHSIIFLVLRVIGSNDNIQPVSAGSFIAYSMNTGIMLMLWSMLYLLQREFKQRRETEIAHWRDQAKLREMELQLLRGQINSHFLFNSLNNVRALILEDAQAARQGLADLATLLRGLLQLENKQTVSLREELEWVRGYLALESLQFEQRLEYGFVIDESLLDEPVPPLLLQTLVENAIKHGIARRRLGGRIEINARLLSDTQWQLLVTNPPAEIMTTHQGNQLGITNTRARLAATFGEQANFELSLGDPVRAQVDLPVHSRTAPMPNIAMG